MLLPLGYQPSTAARSRARGARADVVRLGLARLFGVGRRPRGGGTPAAAPQSGPTPAPAPAPDASTARGGVWEPPAPAGIRG